MSHAESLKKPGRQPSRSTGPRTVQGKARSSLNARWHGLSVRMHSCPRSQEEVARLSAQLTGHSSDIHQRHFARLAAEAMVELSRIQRMRLTLINSHFA